MPSTQKIDDQDGHYIVVPDSELGDRCEFSHILTQYLRADVEPSQTKLYGYWGKERLGRWLRPTIDDHVHGVP